jgi:hypothetical protein
MLTHKPMQDEGHTKASCGASCASCWSSFTTWLKNCWKNNAPSLDTDIKETADFVIKLAEESEEETIDRDPDLSSTEKAMLDGALRQGVTFVENVIAHHKFAPDDHPEGTPAVVLTGDSVAH